MEFLIYSQASALALEADDDPELDERHWTYVDRVAEGLLARGPLLGPDRQSWTGSIHVLAMPSPEAVREFIRDEPYQQAGAYAAHSVWRFSNLIGRTMWEFGTVSEAPLFFLLAPPGPSAPLGPAESPQLPPELAESLAVCGILDEVDAEASVRRGVAAAAPAPDRDAANELFERCFPSLIGAPHELHDWTFGGRR